jgi:hypothetical protein
VISGLPVTRKSRKRAQAAAEYFIIFAFMAILTLLSVSFFFPRVKTIATDFFKKTAYAIIGEQPVASPTKVWIEATYIFRIWNTGTGCYGDPAFAQTVYYNVPDDPTCNDSLPSPKPSTGCWVKYQSMGGATAFTYNVNIWNILWGTTLEGVPVVDAQPPKYCSWLIGWRKYGDPVKNWFYVYFVY